MGLGFRALKVKGSCLSEYAYNQARHLKGDPVFHLKFKTTLNPKIRDLGN